MIALKTSAALAPRPRRPWPIQPTIVSPAFPVLPRSARPTAVVKFKPPIAPAISVSETFQADLVREMIELRRYAVRLCQNDSLADDLIQDTLLNAWNARDRFEAGTNLKAWCTTILRNVFFSYKRRSWRMLPLADEAIAEIPAHGADCGDQLDLLALRNIITLLPQDQREALLLVGAGGLSYIEAAEVCACAIGTVKSRVSRARLRLALLLSENKAGYSTDSSLRAPDALRDLMDQVARIIASKDRAQVRQVACSSDQSVHSEPASSETRVLAKV